MPLNEASGPVRTNLTPEQKQQAERAIYGYQEKRPMAGDLTSTEIEQMRAILKAHDANHQGGMKEFDLNHPPVPPYVHQEYPKHVHGPNGKYLVVHNDEERDEALAQGWQLKHVGLGTPAAAAPELPAEELAEVRELDRVAHQPRKK